MASDLSCKVVLTGQFSNHFLQDLKKLASLIICLHLKTTRLNIKAIS